MSNIILICFFKKRERYFNLQEAILSIKIAFISTK